jgi:hypothetical protein
MCFTLSQQEKSQVVRQIIEQRSWYFLDLGQSLLIQATLAEALQEACLERKLTKQDTRCNDCFGIVYYECKFKRTS